MSTRTARAKIPLDPVGSAVAAGLHYVESTGAGFKRRRSGKGFCYLDCNGRVIRNAAQLKRIRALVIPPAWSEVWICPTANGHLQAFGYDARGRKQYRYHPHYRAFRDETKYARLTQFASVLPRLRKQVDHDLALPGLPREKVLASVVRLLENTFIRVGNIEYAKENNSFGLTTLRNRHVEIDGSTVHFRFRGKSGINHEVEIKDRRVAKVIKACQDLPGYHLFEYLDEENAVRTISSGDVNQYIREITGEEYTAKDFRTWAGTVQTALTLAAIGNFESVTEGNRNIVAAIKDTARRLGNRPATCRKYYVHPAVTGSYLDGTLFQYVHPPPEDDQASLYPEESCVIKLIEAYVTPEKKAA